MADLESEADKLKALINELDKEFSVVRGERKEAQVGAAGFDTAVYKPAVWSMFSMLTLWSSTLRGATKETRV